MAPASGDLLEDLIKSTEAVLEEAETLGVSVGLPPAESKDSEPGPEEVPEGSNENGRCRVTVSKDGLTALAEIHPPMGSGEPVGLAELEDLLAANGIVYGIDTKPAREAILKCATERVPVGGITVARGLAADDEIGAYIVVEPSLLGTQKKTDDKVTVDHKASSPFSIVKKGDVIARMIPRREGVMGTDVRGSALPYHFKTVKYPKPGRNTAWSAAGTVLAECDGRFSVRHGVFSVNQVLDVLGDVDYSTGHIDFPGDVLIKGKIKNGFKVHAGGSIWCAKVVNALDVACGGDLLTNQGILGRGKGSVRAGGGVTARFIENCLVEAGGTVEIKVGCLNSAIRTSARVEMGPTGVIIGGTVFAQLGLTTTQIGSPSGTRTQIHCGTNYAVQRKILLIKDRNAALAFKLKSLEQMAAAGRIAGRQLEDLQERLKGAIHRLNEAARSLVGSLDTNENAEVSVRGTVYTGTSIEICHVPYTVTDPMTRVRFSLDKEKGRIKAERIRYR